MIENLVQFQSSTTDEMAFDKKISLAVILLISFSPTHSSDGDPKYQSANPPEPVTQTVARSHY